MPCSKESAFDLLCAAHEAGRLPHAHLFTGSAGSGKTWLAHRLAGLVMQCPPEAVLAHPDVHFIQPESKSRRIVIDQIRSLERVIQRKPLLTANKVAILHDVDRMQPAAANAFLKTLEEPPPGSILVLTTSLPEAILETVISRCVETSLRGGTVAAGPEADTISNALGDALLDKSGSPTTRAFRLTRTVQELLSEIRAKIAAEYAALLKSESARYKNLTESADWLEEREAQIKALSESTALRERERVLAFVLFALGGALRVVHGGDSSHPVCRRLAEEFSTSDLLQMVDIWHAMQRRLAMNVNETLALEAGFLELVSVAE
jgi:DNA polymerase III subunit delta'